MSRWEFSSRLDIELYCLPIQSSTPNERQPARATDARHDAIPRSRTYRTTYGRIQTVKNGETRSHSWLTCNARVV